MEIYFAERNRILQDAATSATLKSAIVALEGLEAASAVHIASTLFALAELRLYESDESHPSGEYWSSNHSASR